MRTARSPTMRPMTSPLHAAALATTLVASLLALPAVAQQDTPSNDCDPQTVKCATTPPRHDVEVVLPEPFTDFDAFATKTGFRGVVAWSTAELSVGVVHWGGSAENLDQASTPGAPDTAGVVVIDGLEIGETYYVAVEDALTGVTTPARSFVAANAWNALGPNTEQDPTEVSFKPDVYTINLLAQLDSKSLPAEVPYDQAVTDIAQGLSITAERVYDATDGYARIGKVLVMDTVTDYAVNVPFGVEPMIASIARRVPGGEEVADQTCVAGRNLADVMIETTIPFDSHTFLNAIEMPCTSFYVGRVGFLDVNPWASDLEFGATNAHEIFHYAFGALDLYDTETATGGCRNLNWDGSLMNNLVGWRYDHWEQTELDSDPVLTPCDMMDRPYTWDAIQANYTVVPDRTAIEDVFNDKARGNPDGGALRLRGLARSPGSSTLTRITPDDSSDFLIPVCSGGETATSFTDPRDDVELITIGSTPPPQASEPALDVVSGHAEITDTALELTIGLKDLGDQRSAAFSVEMRFHVDGTDHVARAIREVTGDTFELDHIPISGDFLDDADKVVLHVPLVLAADGTEVFRLQPAQAVRGLQAWSGRLLRPFIATADGSGGGCPIVVPGVPLPPVAEPVDATLTVGGDPWEWSAGPLVDALDFGGPCDLQGPCDEQTLRLDVPAGGAIFAIDITQAQASWGVLKTKVIGPDNTIIYKDSEERIRLAVTTPGIYRVTVDPSYAVATYDATAALLEPLPPPEPDATLVDGQTFAADGTTPRDSVFEECEGPGDPRCATYVLDLRPASGSGTLALEVATDIPAEDYDVELYNAAGHRIELVANPGTVMEVGEVSDLAAGTYYLVVVPYVAAEGSRFRVTASLVS